MLISALMPEASAAPGETVIGPVVFPDGFSSGNRGIFMVPMVISGGVSVVLGVAEQI